MKCSVQCWWSCVLLNRLSPRMIIISTDVVVTFISYPCRTAWFGIYGMLRSLILIICLDMWFHISIFETVSYHVRWFCVSRIKLRMTVWLFLHSKWLWLAIPLCDSEIRFVRHRTREKFVVWCVSSIVIFCSSPWHYARANGYGKIHPITVPVCRHRSVVSVVCPVEVLVVP